MSASIRDLSNFRDFPGKIDVERNMYVFPKLYKLAATGKVREWQIFIRLIKKASINVKATKCQNWHLLEEVEVTMKEKYLDGKLPSEIACEYFTETGFIGMQISRSVAVYTKDKNVGRSNERSAFQSALIESRAKYQKRIEEGATLDIPVDTKGKIEKEDVCTIYYFPMLAKNYNDFVGKIKYPVDIQPKLDGLRCVAFLRLPHHKNLSAATAEDVILYSRQNKEFPISESNNIIRENLLSLLVNMYDKKNKCSIYLDGELYVHGLSLQEINSIVRGESSKECQYWVFDCFNPLDMKLSFDKRHITLTEQYNQVFKNSKTREIIKLVSTHRAEDEGKNTEYYRKYLAKRYEGIIIRDITAPYAGNAKKTSATRSKGLLKRKEIFDEEFEVVGFTQGKSGKEVGAVIWIVQTKDGKEFNVVPNMPYNERYELFNKSTKSFDKLYKNLLLTVEFRGWSVDGIPLQAKGKGFRTIL